MQEQVFLVERFQRLLQLSLICLCSWPQLLSATPETWIEPFVSLRGPSTEGRFGDSLACSQVSVTGGSRSLILVGAPEESEGRGAVYLYDPSNPDLALQRITSPAPAAGLHFGAAVVFINDINGDGADDLVVGEPSGPLGSIHVFGSNLSGAAPAYNLCASSAYESSFGARLLSLRGQGGYGDSLVVAAPLSGSTYSFNLFGACAGIIGVTPSFTRVSQGGEFGTALAEVPAAFLAPVATPGAGGSASKVLAGQPSLSGSEAKVYVLWNLGQTLELRHAEEGFGASIGSSHRSLVAAIGSPHRDGGRGGVDLIGNSGQLLCSVAPDASSASQGFGSSLAHIEGLFATVTGREQQFVAKRHEPQTGGSLALFGYSAGPSACSAGVQINNCEEDTLQEQGKVIVGGPDCIVRRHGAGRAALAFSSPGWKDGRGRVDIVVDGSQHSSPISCSSSGPVRPEETAIPVEPGDSSLPAGEVGVSGKKVTVKMPLLQPTLTGENYEQALRKLQRSEGLSAAEARKALRHLEVIYVVTVRAAKSGGAVASSSIRVSGRSSWQYRRKRNQLTFNNLRSGSYSLTWRAIIATKRPPVEIGTAVSRPATRFTVPGR